MVNLLTAFFFLFFLGFFTLSAMLRQASLPHRILFFLGASFPVGAGFCSLTLFASHLLLPSEAKLISTVLSLLAILFLVGYWIRHPQKETFQLNSKLGRMNLWNKHVFLEMLPSLLSFLLFAITLVTVLQYYSLAAPRDIFGGADARYFWTLKAKFLFRSPSEWQGMFSPKLFWSHTDYPLLFPGTFAWGWNWLGHESPFWPPLVSLGFYVSCSLILVWYLSSYVSWTTGWIGGTFFLVLMPYLSWSIYQYADVPLTFFITACSLTLVAALRSGQKNTFIISGLLAGFAAWTKNEGLLFTAWVYILLGGICASRYHEKSREPFAPLRGFSLGALLPLLAFGVIKLFLAPHENYLGTGPLLPTSQGLLISGWDKTLTILGAFYVWMISFEEWKGLWVIFIIAAIFFGLNKKKTPLYFAWILFAIVVLMNLSYVFIFHITPHNLVWHITTSLNRLLLHSGALALAFSFENLTFTCKKPLNTPSLPV